MYGDLHDLFNLYVLGMFVQLFSELFSSRIARTVRWLVMVGYCYDLPSLLCKLVLIHTRKEQQMSVVNLGKKSNEW